MADRDASRLRALRAEIAAQGLDGFLVPRADEHLGEYVPPSAERLAWLTGFTGSAGLAVVLADRAVIFTDGRYVLQLAAETDAELWERRHVTEEPPPAWIVANAPDARIGYDPWLISEEGLARYTQAGIAMVAVARNPIDAIWHDRPPPPAGPALPHPLALAGRSSAEKRQDLAAALRGAGQNAAVLTDPASINWLLNIRGEDVPFTPFALGFAVLHATGRVELFMAAEKLPPITREWLAAQTPAGAAEPESAPPVEIAEPGRLDDALSRLAGHRVRLDTSGSPAWFAQTLRAAGAEIVAAADPCLLPKACKNPVEQQGARAAHRRDAVAMCQFLHWLATDPGPKTEMSAASRLRDFRAALPGFRGESFPTISGAGEHGAIIHYRVTPETDRPIRADEVYLIDSGGQFADGTTDITRTVWTGSSPPPEPLCERFTRVLKGHIAVASLRFPQGVAGPHIDALARVALWQAGLDYDHGTGHGVGSYLSVHEGPAALSRAARPVALSPGMILSDEPGFYLPGAYGIRLENLLLVTPVALPEASKPFLGFETLTLVPFDTRLLAPALLTEAEHAWLRAYHARVVAEISPALPEDTQAWLAAACRL